MTTLLAPTDSPQPPAPTGPRRRSRPELIALAVLLLGTAVLYLWDLGASGWANSYYAAAVQAMTQSWKAFFFGSLDTGNIVTVDKPPASLWVMALSGRIFGFSSVSMLAPQALMGVGTVALIHASVRRVAGPAAGILAGAVMALTPVAVLMFKFNNPDALLVLLIVAAAYATTRAIEKAGTRWLLLAGVLIGFAFLAKMGQAFVVVPALALAYLVAAPTGIWRRIRQLLGAGVAIVVSAGWWVAIVDLLPAADRPYVGGSQTDSVLELALGYNGLGRIFGGERGGFGGAAAGAAGRELPAGFTPPAGGGGFGGFGGQAGVFRMFGSEVGTQVSWLLPAALILLVAALWLGRRAPRIDGTRAALLLWGAWTLVTMVVFSFAAGIFHPYYTVALAPGIAALVGIGGMQLWHHRATWPGRATLAAVVAVTGVWAFVLLDRTPEFLPWLRWAVLALAAVAVIAVLVAPKGKRVATVAAVVALAGLVAPAAYAADTTGTAHTGGMPTAGPGNAGGFPGGGRAFGQGAAGRDRADRGGFARGEAAGGAARGGAAPGGAAPGRATPEGAAPGGAGFGRGGPGEESSNPELTALLKAAGTTWSAATIGAQSGASLELSSDTAVMSIGGFSGSDPAPTLEQFQSYVAGGQVRYFVAGGGGFGGGGSSGIAEWVQQHYTPTTVGGATVYDLAKPVG
ncbi:ArnT family glycosyltransferase [Pseudonocardia sp. GCM10023141]|uniref:ArnT family glycosyltransferase n=1 Tax=Pseudonocardia sp. GCM10023141 TaxID=3252653 RepID=UPI0036072B7C